VSVTGNTARDFWRGLPSGGVGGIGVSGLVGTVDVSFNILEDVADQASSGVSQNVAPTPADLSYLCTNTCLGTLTPLECLSVNGHEDEFQADEDLDSRVNACDICPLDPLNDEDRDGSCGDVDNCPETFNPTQEDLDGDNLGNPCDNCPSDNNPGQEDGDSDAAGDLCDNCPFDHNYSQADFDFDSEGDHCDLDDGLIYVRFQVPDEVAWQAEASFTSWNCYRGDLDVLKTQVLYTQEPGTNALAYRWCGEDLPWVDDLEDPAPGQAAFYLTTGDAGAGESSLGKDSTGAERPNQHPCP
jgi:hypothetical protein